MNWKLGLTLLLTLPLISPAAASDFSGLANPAFGRSILLGSERRQEADCAALAYLPFQETDIIDIADAEAAEDAPTGDRNINTPPASENQFDEFLSKADAERLKNAVIIRLASDVGDEAVAYDLFGSLMWRMTPSWEGSAEDIARKEAFRKAIAPKCGAIFNAARDDHLQEVLTAVSATPISLPDVDTCLAYDLIGQKSSEYHDYADYLHSDRDGDSMYNLLLGKGGAKRSAREKAIEAKAVQIKITPQLAALRMLACLPVLAEEFRRLHPR
ncbi:hypothetical protein DXH95_07535 [Sphingorhabdus pulchriflava]|uniref:Uncharacterized protein n=1 Tax=Sphingorhabdus pulchriflava TaxID=2292257 RepID=A0A371BHY5_9SPHN|nr:hypothetical protein [Sphingorhabdus pulchriflava]RDV07212.1 hypothetical protein DXH95_07535 [Sphingorhabdus pulchriflava]